MGFAPEQIDRMSPMEFNALIDGWENSQKTEDDKPQVPPDFTVHDLRKFLGKE